MFSPELCLLVRAKHLHSRPGCGGRQWAFLFRFLSAAPLEHRPTRRSLPLDKPSQSFSKPHRRELPSYNQGRRTSQLRVSMLTRRLLRWLGGGGCGLRGVEWPVPQSAPPNAAAPPTAALEFRIRTTPLASESDDDLPYRSFACRDLPKKKAGASPSQGILDLSCLCRTG